jgi:hypothetical protein
MVVHLSSDLEKLVQRDHDLDARATAFQEEIGRRLASGPATPMDFSGVKKRIREELEARKGGRP